MSKLHTTRRDNMRGTARSALAVAAASVLLAGCASRHAATDRNRPPMLHIGGQGGAAVASTAAGVNGTIADHIADGFAGYGGYVLAGTLPTTPTHAPVWRWTTATATADEAIKVATAFGVTGTPQRHAHGWLVSSSTGEVRMSDEAAHNWSYARADLDSCDPYWIDIDHLNSVSTGCGGGPAPGTDIPNGPDDATTRAAVAPVVAALGLHGDEQVDVQDPTSSVVLAPTVGGLPTLGLETNFAVDAKGVRWGAGPLSLPTAGDDYPLQTAKQAFAELSNGPHPMLRPYCGSIPPGVDAVATDAPVATDVPAGPAAPTAPSSPAARDTAVAPGPPLVASPATSLAPVQSDATCPSPEPMRVTGATLGLTWSFDGTGADAELMVPAWLFTIEGSTAASPVVAIAPEFIADPVASTSAAPVSGGPAQSVLPTAALSPGTS